MNAYAEHAADLQSLQDELGSDCPTIWYGGRLIRVLPATSRQGNSNSIGGQMLDSDLSIICIASDFATAPKPDEIFRYPGESGKRYRVLDVFNPPTSAQLRITANDAAQGV